MDAATFRAQIEGYFEALTRGDYDAAFRDVTDDFVQDWPQSGERLRGREACLNVYRNYPGGGPKTAIRRVTGGGDTFVVELDYDYAGKPVKGVTIFEMRDGRIARETDYFADPFEPPEWRAQWVEPMPEAATV